MVTRLLAGMWRAVPGFPSYQVSVEGRVRNVRTGRHLSPGLRPDGYMAVSLAAESRTRSMLVHRAVALAWLPNPLGKPTVHHVDRNRANNALANLEWATASEQNRQRCTWTRASPSPEPDMEGELWHACDGDEAVEVSSLGRVRRRGNVVRYAPSDPYVCVFAAGRKQCLHRLVAQAFVPNADPRRHTVVNHIDGNRRNNAASNLEWCTQSDNVRHAHDAGLITPASRAVDQLDAATQRLIRRFESRASAAAAAGVTPAAISNAVAGRSRTAGGFQWRDAAAGEPPGGDRR